MVNNAATPHHISTANPIAQVIILPYMAAMFQEVPRLSETIRGTMTFERTQHHVASSAPSGPQSPLMSPHSLFGDIFPRYIWLWMTYFIMYLSIKYFFVSVFLKFVFLFILLSSVDPFLVFECCFSISLHNIISLFITERQVPPQISVKSPPPLDVQTNSPSSTMDWMTIIILVFILLCLLFGCLCIFLKKCGILGNRCPLCRN